MNELSEKEPIEGQAPSPPAKRRRWKRILRWAVVSVFAVIALGSFLLKDHIRTLRSLRHVPGTNLYVMDYYVDYNIDQIRSEGMDINHVEDSLIQVFFPDWIASIATALKGQFIDEKVEIIPVDVKRCSTVAVHTPTGQVMFGRNFDWKHDACLIVRVHQGGAPASISVIDLHYLNLDRDDLESTSLWERIPLLFAPYYLQDGMNRHGVAVADMSVDNVKPSYETGRPDILHATAMRLILDYAKTTDEALAILGQYNIHFGEVTGHMMIADATGKSAVVEFIDGKMEITTTKESWQVCTNHQICGTSEEDNDKSCDRYLTASDELAKLSASAGTDDVMRIMESVSKENWTMWTSVYDLSSGKFRVTYRRHFDNQYVDSLSDSGD